MPPKLNIEKWAQDIHPAIVFLSVKHAKIARDKSDALRQIKERSIFGHQFPLPDFPSWFAMYRSRKPMFAYKRLISNTSDFDKTQVNFFSGVRKLNKALQKSPDLFSGRIISQQDVENGLKFWREMCANLFEEIREEIADTPLDSEVEGAFNKALVKDELPLGFYFLVQAPCFLLYQMSPNDLYQQALNRDISALEKLLMLDPLVLHDPSIGFQIQSVRLLGKANAYERLLHAIIKQPTIDYQDLANERRNIKSEHGADIYLLANTWKRPLNAPQIRALYDALAQDFDGTLADTDIKSPESFDKTIRTKAAQKQKLLLSAEKQK